MRRLSIVLWLAALFASANAQQVTLFASANAQQVTLTVTNSGDQQRLEVVEADLQAINKLLGTTGDASMIVRNALGQEHPYQKSYDGKLLMYVSVQPHSKAVFTITQGKPTGFKCYVSGKLYFGTDVWVKNIPDLVVEERYKMHMWGVGQRDSLKRAGKPKESSEIYLATSFHHDHGFGLDCYSVGPSLGCGAPALMKNGELIYPYCFKDYKVLDNGPLRFTVELTYHPNADGVTEHRLISLDRGSHYNKMTVWYDGIKQSTAWASGVVLNGDGQLLLGKDYVLYADPTDNPKVHQSQIYVGALFPNGIDETKILKGNKNHGLGILRQYSGKPYTYYFGSAWSSYDVRTMTEWQLLANNYLYNIKNPLITEIK